MTASSLDLNTHAVLRLGHQDVPRVRRLFEECADFFRLVHGDPTCEAAQLFDDVPPGKHRDDKIVFGISGDGGDGYLLALVELVRGYPTVDEWCLGLLLVAPQCRGAGLGAAIAAAVRRFVTSAGARALHIVVHEQNPEAQRFWHRQGFELRGQLIQPATHGTNNVNWLVLPL